MKKLVIVSAVVFFLMSCQPAGDREIAEVVSLSGNLQKTNRDTIKIGENFLKTLSFSGKGAAVNNF